MNFTDLPRKTSRESYDEAITIYRRNVASRIQALYRVGNITYPGLSDIDLLLVTDQTDLDNNQFFAFERLPSRFHALFLHQAFVVPADTLSIIEYTTHFKRELLAGDDIFAASTRLDDPAMNFCRFLESFCHYRAYVSRTRQRGWVSARMIMAVASAFRFSLAEFTSEEPALDPQLYADRIDAIRAAYFQTHADREGLLQEAWRDLSGTVDELEQELTKRLPLRPSQSVAEYAKDFIDGRGVPAEFDLEQVLKRRSMIERYHRALSRLCLSYGYLFYLTAYLSTLRQYHQPPLMRRIAQAAYKPQRLVDELKDRLTAKR